MRDKKFFDWQFIKNPFCGKMPSTIKIFLNEKKVIGCVGSVPLNLTAFGKTEKKRASFFSNLLVEKKFRSVGLGVALVKSLSADNDIIWGLGYKPELAPMYEKMGGWILMGDLKRYIKIMDAKQVEFLSGLKFPKEASENFLNKGMLGGLEIKELKRFGKDANIFWEVISKKYPIAAERSDRYLNWRYSDHPYFEYKIISAYRNEKMVGYLVYRLAETTGGSAKYRVGHVLDLISEDFAVGGLLLEAEKRLKNDGAIFIDYFSTGNFHHKDLIGLGYHLDSESVYREIPMYLNPISHKRSRINFLIYCAKKGKYCERVSDPNNWYITKGDGDKDRPNPH